jgi:arylsulfatase A-like enzyme
MMASPAALATLFCTVLQGAVPSSAAAQPPSFLFILGDDIGWADFRYNNGTAASPHIKKWTESPGTLVMQDFHSGGTVCSPTRATVLTGRNHFRDCVNYVYGCSDMTECVPNFEFSAETFTVPMAVRAANKGYTSWFGGKCVDGRFCALLLPLPSVICACGCSGGT